MAPPRSPARWRRRAAVPLLVLATALTATAPAGAAPEEFEIVLPGAASAEGIAAADGTSFYAGELFTGDIYRGDIRRGTAEEVIDVPDGRFALGMAFDRRTDLLLVAGGFSGQLYAYDTRTGQDAAVLQLADPAGGPTIVNDVALTRGGAWVTDSSRAVLYFVPIGRDGALGEPRTLPVTGPAATLDGEINLNGIRAANGGRVLVVAHTATGAIYTVDPRTGASTRIEGVDVPNVDGLELVGRRLYAVQNTNNQISRIRLDGRITSGEVVEVITSELFQTPTTAAWLAGRLGVVNAKFDTGIPPTADEYEVVVVDD